VQPTNSANFSGSHYILGSNVTPTTTIPEAEEHIAVDPRNYANLDAAVSDFSIGGFNTTKYAYSLQNGIAGGWVENFVPIDPTFGFLVTGDGFFWLANSDPVMANDQTSPENVYLVDLYLDAIDNGNGLYVSSAVRNPDGSFDFTDTHTLPVVTNPSSNTNLTEDKPWITVDNSNSKYSGNVYVSWTHFVGNSDMIWFSLSTNHGQSWSTPVQISPTTQNGAVQGSQVAVGPDGAVYVVYEVFYIGNLRRHFLARSTDGGVSFSSPVPITPYFNEVTFKSTYRKNSFTSLAVNPVSNYVYVVYSDQPSKTVGAEVEFIRSTTPGGSIFTTPVVINDKSSGQQFMPAVTVDSAGVIHASWFDTRNSPTNSSHYDIYATYSRDNGGTFSVNARVTVTTINAGTASFIGDYAGIAASNSFAHPVWTSGGFNNGSLQTTTLTLP
jgi:hypothetical protein